MGVDDGIHMVSRWVEDGMTNVDTTVRETGAAVFLTTISTCIGFGGLLFAKHVGLNTLGWTAAVGMLLCLVASLTTLPALLMLLGKKET
jgi:predicted RND superfamily exporter protein